MPDYKVDFPEYFSGPTELEYEAKGYLPNVVVTLTDGRQFSLFFFDPVRAAQQAEASGMVVEPNLILVRNIDRDNILAAVREAFNQGYFDEVGVLSSQLTS